MPPSPVVQKTPQKEAKIEQVPNRQAQTPVKQTPPPSKQSQQIPNKHAPAPNQSATSHAPAPAPVKPKVVTSSHGGALEGESVIERELREQREREEELR